MLDIIVRVYKGDSYAVVRIANSHTNIVYVEKDGKIFLDNGLNEQIEQDTPDYSFLSVQGIYDFAQMADLKEVKPILERQILYNIAISKEGLKKDYRGEGVVSVGVENTIRNIGRLGKEGMRETDKEILHIMTCVD